jgi:flagellar motor switch protein FliG
MLIFEDVVDIPDADMRPICDMLSVEGLSKALKTAPAQIVDKFLNNMPLAPARLIRNLMEKSQQLTDGEVKSARQEIIEIITRMRTK